MPQNKVTEGLLIKIKKSGKPLSGYFVFCFKLCPSNPADGAGQEVFCEEPASG